MIVFYTIAFVFSWVFLFFIISKILKFSVDQRIKRKLLGTGIAGSLIIIFVLSFLVFFFPAGGFSAINSTPSPVHGDSSMAFIAASIAIGLGSIGAAIAVGMSASSAIGALSENPETFGKSIVFVGLAEGIAIYGLIIAIMILNKI